VEHDQHSLSDLLFYNEEYCAKFPVALVALMNANFFLGGCWYSGFIPMKNPNNPSSSITTSYQEIIRRETRNMHVRI